MAPPIHVRFANTDQVPFKFHYHILSSQYIFITLVPYQTVCVSVINSLKLSWDPLILGPAFKVENKV